MLLLCRLFLICLLFSSAAWAQWRAPIKSPTYLVVSPDGRFVAAGAIEGWLEPGDLRVWDAKTGKLRFKKRYRQGVDALAFSPDGKVLAVATSDEGDEAVHFWDTLTWRKQRVFEGQYLASLSFSSNSKQLATGWNMGENGETASAVLWNLKTGRYRTLPQSDGYGLLKFSRRGERIIGAYPFEYFGEKVGILRLWDSSRRLRWEKPAPELRDVAWFPNGQQLLVGLGDISFNAKKVGAAIQIWDVQTARVIWKMPQSHAVTALEVSRDGNFWATGDTNGAVRLWNAQTRRVIQTLLWGHEKIQSLAFAPDGRTIYGSSGNSVRAAIWSKSKIPIVK